MRIPNNVPTAVLKPGDHFKFTERAAFFFSGPLGEFFGKIEPGCYRVQGKAGSGKTALIRTIYNQLPSNYEKKLIVKSDYYELICINPSDCSVYAYFGCNLEHMPPIRPSTICFTTCAVETSNVVFMSKISKTILMASYGDKIMKATAVAVGNCPTLDIKAVQKRDIFF